jgi:hypothetical protein
MALVFVIKNDATGKVLDSNQTGSVYSQPYNQSDYQKWNVIHSNQGWVNIRNVATGRYLDTSRLGNLGMERIVQTLPSNGGNFQQWVLKPLGYHHYILVNVATGLIIGSDLGGVAMRPDHGGLSQKWHIFAP